MKHTVVWTQAALLALISAGCATVDELPEQGAPDTGPGALEAQDAPTVSSDPGLPPWYVDGQAPPPPDSGPAIEPDTSWCEDLHHKGDQNNPHVEWDGCWDPPLHYCAWGSGGETTGEACTADFSVCCGFADLCMPCGWVDCDTCAPDSPCEVACADVKSLYDPVVCPDTNSAVCWDDFTPPE